MPPTFPPAASPGTSSDACLPLPPTKHHPGYLPGALLLVCSKCLPVAAACAGLLTLPAMEMLRLPALLLVGLIAAIHLYILWLEMFAWTTRGPKVFRSLPAELFPPTKTLAANQGLYNGFLAAGLIWTLLIADPVWQRYVGYFFLGCVAVAGLYGAATAGRRILFVQTLPAVLALVLLTLSR